MNDLTPMDVAAAAAQLFAWNTGTDPYFVIRGRESAVGEDMPSDPYTPIVEAFADMGWRPAGAAITPSLHVLAATIYEGADQTRDARLWHDAHPATQKPYLDAAQAVLDKGILRLPPPTDEQVHALAAAMFDHNAEGSGSPFRYATAPDAMKAAIHAYAATMLARFRVQQVFDQASEDARRALAAVVEEPATHECLFPEEAEPAGRLILAPCLTCDRPAAEGISYLIGRVRELEEAAHG